MNRHSRGVNYYQLIHTKEMMNWSFLELSTTVVGKNAKLESLVNDLNRAAAYFEPPTFGDHHDDEPFKNGHRVHCRCTHYKLTAAWIYLYRFNTMVNQV